MSQLAPPSSGHATLATRSGNKCLPLRTRSLVPARGGSPRASSTGSLGRPPAGRGALTGSPSGA
eukprot:4420444-Lingulodinium_polyedra.AAC.1